jgi:hypothetical protein
MAGLNPKEFLIKYFTFIFSLKNRESTEREGERRNNERVWGSTNEILERKKRERREKEKENLKEGSKQVRINKKGREQKRKRIKRYD